MDDVSENSGWWYDWVLDDRNRRFGFRLSEQAFGEIEERFATNPRERGRYVSPRVGKPWGFERCLTCKRGSDGSVTFLMDATRYRKKPDMAQTLSLIAPVLSPWYMGPRDAGRQQLLILSGLRAEEEMNGWSLGVRVLPAMASWIRERTSEYLVKELAPLLVQTFFPDWSVKQKRTWIENGMMRRCVFLIRPSGELVIEISPNISLGPNAPGCGPSQGYDLVPNNFDGRGCQPPMLAALAKLHQLARRDGL